MHQQEYERLCKECDRILWEQTVDDLVLMCTPWLHVMNEHPTNLAKYRPLASSLWRATLKFLAHLMIARGSSVLCGETPLWFTSRPLPSQLDVIVVSHLLSRDQIDLRSDFYFGDMPEHLEAMGRSVAVVMLNQIDFSTRQSAARTYIHKAVQVLNKPIMGFNSARESAAKTYIHKAVRIFLNPVMGFREEMSIAFKQLRQFIKLLRNSADSTLHLAAAGEVLSRATVENLRLFCQIRSLVETTRAKTIVLTYEGHAWERIVFSAARLANPAIRCVGYHHAIMFPRPHAVARRLRQEFNPDLVVFAGEVTRARFAKLTDLGVPLEVIGTARHDPPIFDLTFKLQTRCESMACLFLPDGTLGESVRLITFATACAQQMPDFKFVVRMHPVLDINVVLSTSPSLARLPANLILSNNSIEDDFARCRWAVYRGSGAAVRAAALGLRPLYLRLTDETMMIDPLYELTRWRKIVTEPRDLESQIRADLTLGIQDINREFLTVRDFLQSYFMPFDMHKFAALVNS